MTSSGTGRFFVKADNEQRMRSFQASIHEEVCGTIRQLDEDADCRCPKLMMVPHHATLTNSYQMMETGKK